MTTLIWENSTRKGSVRTWFGSKNELIELIKAAHDNGLQVYADVVLNHNSGGDEEEVNPIDHSKRWTKFNPTKRGVQAKLEMFPSLTV